jgi:hypothetical protein
MWRRLFVWVRNTLDFLCDRPDHLQRLSIIGAGMSVYPAVFLLVGLLTWFAVKYQSTMDDVVRGLINFGYIFLALFALVIVALLGTIKGLRLGPGGLEVITTADDPDVDPQTTRDTRLAASTGAPAWGGPASAPRQPVIPVAGVAAAPVTGTPGAKQPATVTD